VKRDQRLIVAAAAVAVVAGGSVAAGYALDEPPPVPAIVRDVPVGPDGVLSVQFVGDVYLGDDLQDEVDRRAAGYDWPFDSVRATMSAADYTVAVAEAPISGHTTPWNARKRFSHSSRPQVAGAFARAGIDAVTLANNHAFDTGPNGLADTMTHLDAAGIASIGAGPDIARAEQPLLLRTELGTLGIVALGESFGFEATRDTPGTVVMRPKTVQRSVALARAAGADWVIAFAHWGDNYTPINAAQRTLAADFAAAGVDLVVASGPHIVQPIEFIGRMPVVFSVGNFVFGTPGRFQQFGVPGLGLSVELQLSAAHPPQLAVRCIVTDNGIVGFQPRPCDPATTAALMPTLHPGIALRDDMGVLACPDCPRAVDGPP
jgi:cyanophycin synthetase